MVTGRILLVEDDVALAMLYQRVLGAHGFEVELAATGKDGLACATRSRFDAIVSDIAMPEMDGVHLLERLHESDPLVPVLLLTGQAEVETVQRAIELQAFRYLVKPVNLQALVASVRRAASCCRWMRARQEAELKAPSFARTTLEGAELTASFRDALGLLRVYYQPVVDARGRQLRGVRSMARSLHPLFPSFADLRRAADLVGMREELRRKLWSMTAAPLELLDETLLLLVWTDVAGLADVQSSGVLNARARQTVLMVSDREGMAESANEKKAVKSLRAAGFRLGIDQLGEGYAGLNSLAWLEPEFLELESTLLRRIARDPEKQRLVSALSGLAKELDATLIAEGVAGEEDAQVLSQVGCDLLSWDLSVTPDDLAPFSAHTASTLQGTSPLLAIRDPRFRS